MVANKGKFAVVLLSGGLDSMVAGGLAREAGYHVLALTIDYNQRHRVELQAAAKVAAALNAMSHIVLPLDLTAFGGSALTADLEVPKGGVGSSIPITYVPARNTIFLSLAMGWAEVLEADAIYIGVNAVDYSGYPDCRPAFIAAFQSLANVATRQAIEGAPVEIVAPLISLSKAEIIAQGAALGVDYAATVSCYTADNEGAACGECDSCRIRRQGFFDAGIADPTRYRIKT